MNIYKLSENFKGIKKGDIIVNAYYGNVHQTYGDIKPQVHHMLYNIPNEIKEELTDLELYKISHHLLTERKYNVYSTKKTVEDELIKRGFVFDETKRKWYKKREE